MCSSRTLFSIYAQQPHLRLHGKISHEMHKNLGKNTNYTRKLVTSCRTPADYWRMFLQGSPSEKLIQGDLLKLL
jgi:hypothetical protein